MNRRYGVRTSAVYGVDGVALSLGVDLVGFGAQPHSEAAMNLLEYH